MWGVMPGCVCLPLPAPGGGGGVEVLVLHSGRLGVLFSLWMGGGACAFFLEGGINGRF